MKQLDQYKDKFGLITVGASRDGGDTCANECTIAYTNRMQDRFVLFFFNRAEKKLVRHPDTDRWYGFENRFSRDQFIPLLICLSTFRFNKARWEVFFKHLLHGFLFAWNTRRNYRYPTLDQHLRAKELGHIGREIEHEWKWKMPDLTGPEIWALWIRVFRCYPLYPLLFLFDLETLVGTLVKNKSEDNIHRNHILILHHGKKVMTTPIMWLARKLYDKDNARERNNRHYQHGSYPPINKYLNRLLEEL